MAASGTYTERDHVHVRDLVDFRVVQGANVLSVLDDAQVIHPENIHDADDAVDGAPVDAPRTCQHRVVLHHGDVRRVPIDHQSLDANFNEVLASQLEKKQSKSVRCETDGALS